MRKSKILLVLIMLMGILQVKLFASENVVWDSNYKADTVKVLEKGLTVDTGGIPLNFIRATEPKYNGKWYWEVTLDSGNAGMYIGTIDSEASKGRLNGSWRSYYPCQGEFYSGSSLDASNQVIGKTGDTIGLALDMDNGTLSFYVQGVKLDAQYNGIDEKGIYPMIAGGSTNHPCITTTNFGVTPFKYEIPDGFLPYDTTAPVTTNSLISVLLEADETVQLSVTSNLEDNTNLTWSSMNEDVATVDKNGKVTAKGEGLTQIYAQNEDGSFKQYINIRVVEKGEAEELRLALNLNVGKNQRLYLNDDYENIEWTSQDKSIATIDKNGKVKAVSEGLVIINATYKDETQMIYVRVTE